jgi:hypothetical protein
VNFVDGTTREFTPEINTMYTVSPDGTVDVVFSRPDVEPTEAPEAEERSTPKPTPTPDEKSTEPEPPAKPEENPAGQGASEDGQAQPADTQPSGERETGSTSEPDTSAPTSLPTSDPVDETVTSGVAPVLVVAIAPFLDW